MTFRSFRSANETILTNTLDSFGVFFPRKTSPIGLRRKLVNPGPKDTNAAVEIVDKTLVISFLQCFL